MESMRKPYHHSKRDAITGRKIMDGTVLSKKNVTTIELDEYFNTEGGINDGEEIL